MPRRVRRDDRDFGRRSRRDGPRGHRSVDGSERPAAARARLPVARASGGVLQRVGQTEASIDLARLAGLYPAGVICEILIPMVRWHAGPTSSGSPKSMASLHHGRAARCLPAEARAARPSGAEARLPTPFGEFRIIGYRNDVDDAEHIGLVFGDVAGKQQVLVRMHSKC